MKVNFRKLQKTLFIAFVFFWSLHPQNSLWQFLFAFFFLLFASVEVQSEKFLFLQYSVFLLHFCARRIEIACKVYFQRANKWVENKRWQCYWWLGCRKNSPSDASVQEKMASFQWVYRSHRTTVLGVLILPFLHFIADESVCKVRFQYHSVEHRSENKSFSDQNILKRVQIVQICILMEFLLFMFYERIFRNIFYLKKINVNFFYYFPFFFKYHFQIIFAKFL